MIWVSATLRVFVHGLAASALAAVDPAQPLQFLLEGGHLPTHLRIAVRMRLEHADPPDQFRLLRAQSAATR
jgi:hypothetical protein